MWGKTSNRNLLVSLLTLFLSKLLVCNSAPLGWCFVVVLIPISLPLLFQLVFLPYTLRAVMFSNSSLSNNFRLDLLSK